jgi:predicted enzyme related to lactoylglutathione lyase
LSEQLGTLERTVKIEFTLDCNELSSISVFWQHALRCEADETVPGRYVSLSPADLGITLNLQAVPEPKSGKNRMHFDLLVDDLEDVVSDLRAHGASQLSAHEEFGGRWYVMADPEGNEFCVAQLGPGDT